MAATKKRKAEVQLDTERPISQRPTPMERGFGKWSAGPEDAKHLSLGDGASILYLRGLFSPSECKRLQQVLLTDLQVNHSHRLLFSTVQHHIMLLISCPQQSWRCRRERRVPEAEASSSVRSRSGTSATCAVQSSDWTVLAPAPF